MEGVCCCVHLLDSNGYVGYSRQLHLFWWNGSGIVVKEYMTSYSTVVGWALQVLCSWYRRRCCIATSRMSKASGSWCFTGGFHFLSHSNKLLRLFQWLIHLQLCTAECPLSIAQPAHPAHVYEATLGQWGSAMKWAGPENNRLCRWCRQPTLCEVTNLKVPHVTLHRGNTITEWRSEV